MSILDLDAAIHPPAWHAQGACAQIGAGWDLEETAHITPMHRATCSACPVWNDCAAEVLTSPEHHVGVVRVGRYIAGNVGLRRRAVAAIAAELELRNQGAA